MLLAVALQQWFSTFFHLQTPLEILNGGVDPFGNTLSEYIVEFCSVSFQSFMDTLGRVRGPRLRTTALEYEIINLREEE